MTYIDNPSTTPSLLEQERDLLTRIAKGGPLNDVLNDIIHLVEKPSNGEMLASILFVSEEGGRLLEGAAPSLPKAYNDAIHGIKIGDGVGSCGTAAFTKEPVYVADIATDPLWAAFKDLALSHDLKACWSVPIKDADGRVIGTFANYYKEPRAPTERDMEVISMVAHTAAIAIERHRRELERERAEEKRILLLRELNHRVKNVFAIATSLVTMSGRTATSTKELVTTIQGRLGALGRAHELVQPGLGYSPLDQVTAVSLDDVLHHILAPYESHDAPHRLHTDGPDIRITPDAVTSMALVFHELATNAAKYGALSAVSGSVRVTWERSADHLQVDWMERGGPPVQKPAKVGFGSTLSQRSVEGQIGGTITYDWKPEGLTVRMTLPIATVCAH